MRAIIGKKIGMTRFFDEAGVSNSATVIETGPCYVTQIKSKDTDGYDSVQVSYGEKNEKHVTKPLKGHFDKAKVSPAILLKEFRDLESEEPLKPGDAINLDAFTSGDIVSVTGLSKGKGFAGVMKRHNFGGGQKTHGQSDRLRAPGSIGQSSSPSRVFKGMKMAGQMGSKTVTVKGLQVLKVDPENNILIIKGAVPGANKGIVLIRK